MRIQKKWLQSFGRRSARKLEGRKIRLVDELLPKIRVDLNNVADVVATAKNNQQQIWMEIGFGGGEHLAHQAEQNPDVLFFGCEPFIDGVAKLLCDIEDKNLTNIRLFTDDARLLLEALPKDSIDKVFILFADPWPKRKHHKRRIINQETLGMLAAVIQPNAELQIATDHVDYAQWILHHMLASDDFAWKAECRADWQQEPKGWIKTRYQQKAEEVGRASQFFIFYRI